MKSVVIAALGLSLLGGNAFAADLVINEVPAPTYAASAYDWTGFYIGINGGYAGGTFEHPLTVENDNTDLLDGSLDITSGGFVGGVQAGGNWQMDNFVLGIEADVQGSSVDGRLSLSGTDEVGVIGDPGDTLDADAGTHLDYFGTLRGRAGVTMDQALFYATGGLAWGRTTSSVGVEINDTSVFDVDSENDRFGFTVGAGIEYALTDNLTFKTEYLYTDLGTEELLSEDFGDTTVTLDSAVAFHTVRAGLNFQF